MANKKDKAVTPVEVKANTSNDEEFTTFDKIPKKEIEVPAEANEFVEIKPSKAPDTPEEKKEVKPAEKPVEKKEVTPVTESLVGKIVTLNEDVKITVTGTPIPSTAYRNKYIVEKVLDDRIVIAAVARRSYKFPLKKTDVTCVQ